MGKNKKKKKKFNEDCPVSKEVLDDIANKFEAYFEEVDTYIIKDNINAEKWNNTVKKFNKIIKKVRKGEIDDIVDLEKYEEAMRGDCPGFYEQ